MFPQLPIHTILPAVRSQLAAQNTLIVQAPPGAGKSTVLPLALLDAPWLAGQKILMLEPRRLAARAVARRMADLRGERVGQTVGYRVRFDRKVGPDTRIEVLTEGILTRMIQQDNALEGVGLVIFDEFHERSLQADLGLALTRQVQDILREDLRLLLMSATLDTDELSVLLDHCPTLQSEGRPYPVELRYLPPPPGERLQISVARAVRQALREVPEGDLLVFLPGTADIRRTAEQLVDLSEAAVLQLYGDLPPAEQERALRPDPAGRRKVVLSTSIAETSLTIEGVGVVIDSGKARVPRFDPRSGFTRLETVDVTRDAADQRSGRSGRLGPGVAYRLWAEGYHRHLIPFRAPEIQSADLAPLALELAAWGVQDPEELTWATAPPAGALAQARDLLTQLQALAAGKLTAHGKALLRLPTHPRVAHMLETARKMGLSALATDVAALLEERDPLPRGSGADLRLRLDALRTFRAGGRSPGIPKVLARVERVAKVWRRILRCGPPATAGASDDAGQLIAAVYPDRVARNMDPAHGRFRLPNGRPARIEAHDPLAEFPWLAVAQLDAGQSEGRIWSAAPVDPEMLSHLIHREEVVQWDHATGRLRARMEQRIGRLLVDHRPLTAVAEAARIAVLCAAVQQEPSLLARTEPLEQWRKRVMSLRAWRTEEAWPDLSWETLLAEVEPWLGMYLAEVRKREDFGRIDLRPVLRGLLPWELGARVEALAPTHLEVPSGSRIRLEYAEDGRPPVLAVRLQEMFGQLETPRVNAGRTRVMVHLLSPARRPVQVTQDLRGFWAGSYQDVRKDLRGRYSKHYWPEDPFTAQAIRGVKPRKKK
ncbi:MAG: ATP-dependent helicase HrpB [Bacteroidota bacterium]